MAKKKRKPTELEPTTKKLSTQIWHRVKQPIPWKGEKGDELIGKYTVSIQKHGRFGEYFQHCIMTEDRTYFVTGTIVNSLFAHVPPGEIVKLKCLGESKQVDGYLKLYELFTARPISMKLDGEILEEPAQAIPEYKPPEEGNDPAY